MVTRSACARALTASGYRAVFGRLPKGGESGTNRFYLAARVGKDRSTVANALRLLRLPEAIKQAIVAGQLSMGHARALLAVADEGDLRKAAATTSARK